MIPRTRYATQLDTLTVYRVGSRTTVVVKSAAGLVLTADLAHGALAKEDLEELYGVPLTKGRTVTGTNGAGVPWTATSFHAARGGDL